MGCISGFRLRGRQLEGDSLEAQRSETTKYIEYKKSQQGWGVESIEYYVDAGRSAKGSESSELQRLKLDTAASKLDMVACFKLDRITRSLLDFVELWKLFSDHDVRVISLREDFDTSTVMGEAMVKLIMVFAELERQLTAERTVATMKDRVSRDSGMVATSTGICPILMSQDGLFPTLSGLRISRPTSSTLSRILDLQEPYSVIC